VGVFEDPGIELTPEQVSERMHTDPRVQVVDVREQYEWDAGRVAGAIHVELERLAGRSGEIDRDRPVIFQCRLGARSGMAAHAFRAAGYEAHNMTGGLTRWHAEGLPLEPEDGFVADH
jgi:rhodanese-related sulfurtransferase